MANDIHVAFAVDRGYLDQAAVTISSIVANASDPSAVHFYILHDEDEGWVSDRIATWSTKRPTAVRVKSPFGTFHPKPGSSWTTAMLLRLLLPATLPQLERVLYLDADIVVLRDIAELWRTDLGRASAAGVVDMGLGLLLGRGEVYRSYATRDHLTSLGFDPAHPTYVNSGLLLLDLEKLRRSDFTRLALEMDISRRDKLLYMDQDIINSILRSDMLLLDPRWNVHAQVMSRGFRRRHHYILRSLQADLSLQHAEQWAVHYTGPKPWSSSGVWQEDEWWRYAQLTGVDWPRPAPGKRSIAVGVREGWLDMSSRFSVIRHKIRKSRSRTTLDGGK